MFIRDELIFVLSGAPEPDATLMRHWRQIHGGHADRVLKLLAADPGVAVPERTSDEV